ncbi:MAG: hypothetical protein RLZZ546_1063 [Bacteroidota bacterium]|jgi:hypothetical protein
MGLEIKRNKKGEYSLTSTVSDESYHPEKKWITEDEAKKLLIERAFYKFVEDAIQIDMTFPNRYTVNDKYHYDDKIPNFNEWYLGILKDDNHGKKLFEKFNEVLKKHDMDLNTDTE